MSNRRSMLFLCIFPIVLCACALLTAPAQPTQVDSPLPAVSPVPTWPEKPSTPTQQDEPLPSPTQTELPGPAVQITNCDSFPANNFWNAAIDQLPVHAMSEQWIESIGSGESLHMDFGSGSWDGGPIGIPYNLIADAGETKFSLQFEYAGESDPGPYPIPANPQVEYGSDHHILLVEPGTCTLYEIYAAHFADGQWSGGSGAIWNLGENDLRPADWTSADAAGLPIFPGLARYAEITSGEITHALRFTAEDTAGYIWPARHQTSDAKMGIPPMGARFRLKAGYDISGFPPEEQIILRAMKKYGLVLADNGSNWYVSGAPAEGWDNEKLHLLDVLRGADFEAIDTARMMVDLNSGEVRP